MKYMTRIFALTLTLMPLLAAAQLSQSAKIVAQVPFEFVAENRTIPAGECILRAATPGWRTIVINNRTAHMSLFANALVDEAKKPSSHYALVFRVVEGKYFLAEMKLADSKTIYRLRKSKAEEELRSQNQNVKPSEMVLLASVQ